MALYFGKTKVKVGLGGTIYCVQVPSFPSESYSIRLITYDGFALVDKNGLFLTVKEGE